MIFSSNLLKRWSFQKGPRWHMIFLVLSGQKVKDGPTEEIHGNMMHRPAKKNRKPDI